MSDIPVVAAFLYIFITFNYYGWGILHDKRFIGFVLGVALLYISTYALELLGKTRLANYAKILLLTAFIAVAVLGATVQFMTLRQKTDTIGFINDSGLQLEIGGRYVLLGKNPYSESYAKTDLARAPYLDDAKNTVNPALNHNAYPPLSLLMSAAGYRIFARLLGWFDMRILSLIFYFFLIAAIALRFKVGVKLVLFLALIAINPMFLNGMMQGSNDIFAITFIVISLMFLEKTRFLMSGIFYGLAVATKQTAWIGIPLFLFYVYKTGRTNGLLKFAVPSAVVSLVLFLPYILWNPTALVNSLVFYMSGSLPTSYPINNFGFGSALVVMGIIPTVYNYYPFWIWQLLFAVPALGFLFWVQRKKATIDWLWFGFTLLLAITWFFNRFMNFSYLSVILVFLGLFVVWHDPEMKHSIKTKHKLQ